MGKLFEFDFSGSSGSPLRIYDAAGDLLFDGNWACLRKNGIYTAPLNYNSSGQTGVGQATNAYSHNALNKTFSKPPFFTAWAYSGSGGWHQAFLQWSSTAQYTAGAFAIASTTQITFGNLNTISPISMAALVFENGADG